MERSFLGELLVCRSSIQLSMVRAELGCATTGKLECGYGDRFRWYGSSIGLVDSALGSVPPWPDAALRWPPIRQRFFKTSAAIFYTAISTPPQQKAEKARKDFSANGADWAMKFRLLEAEILTYQGRRPEVIALLNSPGVIYPTVGDLAIKRNLLCGLAHARLGQAQQADAELQEAQRLSDASNSVSEWRGPADGSHRSNLSKPLARGCGSLQKKFAGRQGTAGLIP